MNKVSTRPQREKLTTKLRQLAKAAIEPNWTLPGLFSVIVFLGADKAAFLSNSERAMVIDITQNRVVASAIMALYVFVPLAIVTQLRFKYQHLFNSGTSYLIGTLASITATVFLIELTLGPNIALALSNGIRLFIGAFLLSLVIGQYRKFVEVELLKSTGTIVELEQQRKLLIEADEKTRRDIANVLHDVVQSKLVVSATRLNELVSTSPEPLASELEQILVDLENLRRLDVRTASRTLSPDIQIIGLKECLMDLAKLYSPSMNISFDFDTLADQAETQAGLAVYRICEQSFMNALSHGSAKNCVVKLRETKGWLNLEIENNGSPVEVIRSGATGSAVINAWVASLYGTWSISNQETSSGSKVVVKAKLKLEPQIVSQSLK